MEQMEQLKNTTLEERGSSSLEWLRTQISKLGKEQGPSTEETEEQERLRKEQVEREAQLIELRKQQDELNQKIEQLQGAGKPSRPDNREEDLTDMLKKALMQGNNSSQDLMMEQLKTSLS